MANDAVGPIVMPTLYKQLLIDNIGSETGVDDLEQCFKPALKQCGPKDKTRPDIQLAVDKKGRSKGYATIVVPVSKVDLFLNFDGWYVNKHQMKVTIVESHDVNTKWESTKKGVFTTSITKSSRSTLSQTVSSPYRLIDGGVYLTSSKFKAPDEVIRTAVSCGVEKLVSLGTSIYHSQEALKLSRLFSGTVFCTAGVSPRNAEYWTDDMERLLEEVASCRECVAIGVCGFDLSTDALMATAAQQMEAFEKQLQLACRLGKPVVVSDDHASSEVMSMLSKYKDQLTKVAIILKPVDQDGIQKYLDEGFYYFISGDVLKTNQHSEMRRLLKDAKYVEYLHQFLLSSRAPLKLYHQINESVSHLPQVTEEVSDFMNMEMAVVAEKLHKNVETFYDLAAKSCDENTECDNQTKLGETAETKLGETAETNLAETAETKIGETAETKIGETADETEKNLSRTETIDERQSDKESETISGEKSDSTADEKETDSRDVSITLMASDVENLEVNTETENKTDVENNGDSNTSNTEESMNETQKTESSSSESGTDKASSNEVHEKHLKEADDILRNRSVDAAVVSSASTDCKESVQDFHPDRVSEHDGADSETKSHERQDMKFESQDQTSAVKTDWTYRIVLWMAFITGLLAMYFYYD